jgi:hypothetical protein
MKRTASRTAFLRSLLSDLEHGSDIFLRSAGDHSLDDRNIHNHRCENLNSDIPTHSLLSIKIYNVETQTHYRSPRAFPNEFLFGKHDPSPLQTVCNNML